VLDSESGAFFLERDFHQNESNMRFSGRGIVINGVAPIYATPFIRVLQLENLIFDSF
jgi:hypothetical protein